MNSLVSHGREKTLNSLVWHLVPNLFFQPHYFEEKFTFFNNMVYGLVPSLKTCTHFSPVYLLYFCASFLYFPPLFSHSAEFLTLFWVAPFQFLPHEAVQANPMVTGSIWPGSNTPYLWYACPCIISPPVWAGSSALLRKKERKSLSRVQLFATPRTVAYQALLSMGFSRQEYWSGLPFPSPCLAPNKQIELSKVMR